MSDDAQHTSEAVSFLQTNRLIAKGCIGRSTGSENTAMSQRTLTVNHEDVKVISYGGNIRAK